MHTREIKALIHRSRVVDVISALWSAGFRGVSLIDTFAHPLLLEAKQRQQSQGIGQDATAPLVTIEFMCDSETETAEAIAVIRANAKTAEPVAGRIYVSGLLTTVDLGT